MQEEIVKAVASKYHKTPSQVENINVHLGVEEFKKKFLSEGFATLVDSTRNERHS